MADTLSTEQKAWLMTRFYIEGPGNSQSYTGCFANAHDVSTLVKKGFASYSFEDKEITGIKLSERGIMTARSMLQ